MVIFAQDVRPLPPGVRWLDIIIATLLRMLALSFLAYALFIWSRAVGFVPDATLARFDDLTAVDRGLAAVQLVLLPVVAVGLWTVHAWGRAVWFAAIALDVLAVAILGNDAWWRGVVLVVHLSALLGYLTLLLARFAVDKKG